MFDDVASTIHHFLPDGRQHHSGRRPNRGMAVQVDPMEPTLKASAWIILSA